MSVEFKIGGRRVMLAAPFVYAGETISEIVLAPFKLDDSIRWGLGDFGSALALLAHKSGLTESVLRELTYPDAEIVLSVFMAYLPAQIREEIEANRVPVAQVRPEDMPKAPPGYLDSEPPQRAPTGGVDVGGMSDDERDRFLASQYGPDPTAENHPHMSGLDIPDA